MTVSVKEFIIKQDIKTVWNIVVDLEHYAWRSDIKKIDILDERTFVEHSNDGFDTTFVISKFEPARCYAFTIDNKNMHGTWVGIFEECEEGTKLTFKEDVEVKHVIMKLFIKKFLHRQQIRYAKDLCKVFTSKGYI